MDEQHEGGEQKSVLDGIQVEDGAFPLNTHLRRQMEKMSKPAKSIVGACARCGSPIYGHLKLHEGDDPETVFSCKCSEDAISLKQLMMVKEEGMVREGK